ncbi:MAG: hypothetical protein ACLFM0_07380, partial [Spirochaetales bacterium]
VRGRFVVRNVEARDISFGGERTESGELPPERRPAAVDDDRQRASAAERVSALFGETSGELRGMISEIDAREIVAAELAELSTPDTVAREQERIDDRVAEWEQRIAEAETAVSEFRGDVETLLAIDPSAIDSVSRLRDAVETAERVTDGGEEFYERGLDGYRAAATARDDLVAAIDAVGEALERDISYIESRIPDPETVLREPFAGLVSSIAEEHVAPYVERGRTAYEAYLRLQRFRDRLADDSVAVEERPGRGRDLVFPSSDYPRFLLERAAVSFVEGEYEYIGTLREVSSDPALTGGPARAQFIWSRGSEGGGDFLDDRDSRTVPGPDRSETHDRDGDGASGGDVQVELDMRNAAESRVAVYLDLFGGRMSFPIGQAGVIPVDRLRSDFDLSSEVRISPEGSVRFRGDSRLFRPDVGFSTENEVTRRTQAVLDRTETVTAGITLPPRDGRAVRTNLDQALASEIEAFIVELRDRALEEADGYVRDQFSSEIDRVEQLIAEGVAVVDQAQARYDELVELYEQAQQERARIEARLADLEQEVERRAREEVERAEQRAREEVERAEQRAREEAERAERRAREEAERAEQGARDEVEDRVRDRLDGFMGR